jgi:hypothetical protein
MSGAIPPLQYAFMAWSSVTKKKAQGQLHGFRLKSESYGMNVILDQNKHNSY